MVRSLIKNKGILLFMVIFAVMQGTEMVQAFIVELFLYEVIRKTYRYYLKGNEKEKKKSKYKYESYDDEINEMLEDSNAFYSDDIKEKIEELKEINEEDRKRIENYDYRQFKGRKDVTWEEVYEYLYNQYRYKGMMMWIEYTRELEKEEIINNKDVKEILKKGFKTVSFSPRKIEEEIHKRKLEKNRQWDKEREIKQDKIIEFAEEMEEIGATGFSKMIDIHRKEENEDYMKMFYYEEFLKQKGYVK